MSDAVVVAIVSGLLTLLGTIITVVLSHKSTIATLEKQSALADQEIKGQIAVINSKLQALEDKQDKHNQMIERTYSLEQRCSVIEERIKVANNRIKDLEGGQGQ